MFVPCAGTRRLAVVGFLAITLRFCIPVAHADQPPIRVAIYDDAGGGGAGPSNMERCLPASEGFVTKRVKGEDIRNGVLADFDVLIQPGGSGSKQAATLGEEGRENIRKFVDAGGGYLGVCAGAYLASADYSWSLGLLDAKVVDRAHWARGTGDVELRVSDKGCKLLGIQNDKVTVYYGQGPLLAPADNATIPDYEELAVYETEIAKKGAPTGVMKGTTAAARGAFGRGHVFCFSPHPEKTAGLDNFITSAVRWAAGREAAAAAE
ncbi:MAG TPA: BPL-N domain-containing protein [Pirellulales bacterium]|nr:BPL-N domain-containing protein [Pirellulales bacterium]